MRERLGRHRKTGARNRHTAFNDTARHSTARTDSHCGPLVEIHVPFRVGLWKARLGTCTLAVSAVSCVDNSEWWGVLEGHHTIPRLHPDPTTPECIARPTHPRWTMRCGAHIADRQTHTHRHHKHRYGCVWTTPRVAKQSARSARDGRRWGSTDRTRCGNAPGRPKSPQLSCLDLRDRGNG